MLTAAHCIAWGKGALKLKLIIGDHDLRNKRDKARHVVRKVMHNYFIKQSIIIMNL